jgi:hypothetical protein
MLQTDTDGGTKTTEAKVANGRTSHIVDFIFGAPGWRAYLLANIGRPQKDDKGVWSVPEEDMQVFESPVVGFAVVKNLGGINLTLAVRMASKKQVIHPLDEDFTTVKGGNFIYFFVAPGENFLECRKQAEEELREHMKAGSQGSQEYICNGKDLWPIEVGSEAEAKLKALLKANETNC